MKKYDEQRKRQIAADCNRTEQRFNRMLDEVRADIRKLHARIDGSRRQREGVPPLFDAFDIDLFRRILSQA